MEVEEQSDTDSRRREEGAHLHEDTGPASVFLLSPLNDSSSRGGGGRTRGGAEGIGGPLSGEQL